MILRERLASIPDVLQRALAVPLVGVERLRAMRRFVVTGGGLSEGPARVLVALLQRQGRDARFVAQSRFVDWPEPRADDAALVLFSQGLAPNARLPLPFIDRFGLFALVTSVPPERTLDLPGLVWRMPPESEDGLLLRVVGPAVSVLTALRIADVDVHGAIAKSHVEGGEDLFGPSRRPIALVVDERLVDLAMPLRWKLLEGLRIPDPPVWDVLQVAHGPLQSLYEQEHTIVTLRCGPPRHDDLFARLERVLHPARHRVIKLSTNTEGPAVIVELDAALNACLLATLTAHPLALDDWPARGLDGPLYDVAP